MASSSLRRWPTAVTPDLLEVVGRELGQDLAVDLVVAERLLVPAQAEPAQPSPDVHRRPLDRARPPAWA